jgi:hypothetical protein
LLSCGSGYSLIELALLSDPDSVLYRDQCYCACLGHLLRPPLSFQSRFTVDPVAANIDGFAAHRRQSPGEASALAIEVVARIR